MSVNPKMCDLDPLSPLSLSRLCRWYWCSLALVFSALCFALLSSSSSSSVALVVSVILLLFSFICLSTTLRLFFIVRFFSLFSGLCFFFFFFFSWGDFGFVVFVFPSGGCFCYPCCSIEREVRMCRRGKRTGHMNAGKTE